MFKDIPWYEGLYKINIYTQEVKSLERIHEWFWYIKKERILKPHIRKDLYHSFIFCRWKEMNRVYLHRLVMFIKEWPCPEWMEVCHNDWNPANNHPDNLRYWTRKDNSNDAKIHWTRFNIENVKPDTSKKCLYMFKWYTYYFNSAKEMSIHLWIKYRHCTFLIRRHNVRYWEYKWYFFKYI